MYNLSFADEKMEELPWKNKNFWVSQYNYLPEIQEKFDKPSEIIIHDSTLRDGEQAPGVSFNKKQKIEIAKRLDEIGVQYIEAGFPAVSKADQETIKAISELDINAKVTCLSRATKEDIDLAIECGVWGAILEVPAGYPRLKYQFNWSEEEVIEKTMFALNYAKNTDLHIILFLIDATRARAKFLKKLLTKAENTGIVDKISIVDTLGVASPDAIRAMVSTVKTWVDIPLELHFHNDFGLATINTISGLMAGARSFSCTINGLGQRAGNAPLEEIVLALNLLYGVETNLDIKKLKELSEYLKKITNIDLPPYKPVVGDKLFNWAAGIPTASLRNEPLTVEPYTPEYIGAEHVIVLGKKAGKANILYKLEEFDYSYDKKLVEKLLKEVKDLAIEKNDTVTDQEFKEIYHSSIKE